MLVGDGVEVSIHGWAARTPQCLRVVAASDGRSAPKRSVPPAPEEVEGTRWRAPARVRAARRVREHPTRARRRAVCAASASCESERVQVPTGGGLSAWPRAGREGSSESRAKRPGPARGRIAPRSGDTSCGEDARVSRRGQSDERFRTDRRGAAAASLMQDARSGNRQGRPRSLADGLAFRFLLSSPGSPGTGPQLDQQCALVTPRCAVTLEKIADT